MNNSNDPVLRARYAPGGDIYQKYNSLYGKNGADEIWNAFQTDGSIGATNKLVELKYGQPLNESTTEQFLYQLTTDPLAAPLETANKGIGTAVTSAIKGIFSNPWVFLFIVAIGVGLFFHFGGGKFLKKAK